MPFHIPKLLVYHHYLHIIQYWNKADWWHFVKICTWILMNSKIRDLINTKETSPNPKRTHTLHIPIPTPRAHPKNCKQYLVFPAWRLTLQVFICPRLDLHPSFLSLCKSHRNHLQVLHMISFAILNLQ